MNDKGGDNFHAIADRVLSKERPALPAAARVTPLRIEHLLVRDALASIPINVEDAPARVVIDSSANSSATDCHLLTLLGRMVLSTFNKMLRSLDTLQTITHDMVESSRFIAAVAALEESDHNSLTTEQAKIDSQCRQFVESGTKND